MRERENFFFDGEGTPTKERKTEILYYYGNGKIYKQKTVIKPTGNSFNDLMN